MCPVAVLAGSANADVFEKFAGGDCASLADHELAHVDIFAAQRVTAGTFITPDGVRLDVPAFCRVQGAARPTADSQIGFELWLPETGWNGRYYQLGNGGFAGRIHYPSLAAELRRQNAVAVSDTGHRGDGFDATWARGHPEKIVDYGYRSVKETSQPAKALIRAYYGRAPRYSYFTGCSNGGRQALMAAQRFPRDWDGILVGAPAVYWTRQLASFAWIQRTLRTDSESWISPAQLPAIQRRMIDSCSSTARVVNEIPVDPRLCPFDPAALRCAEDGASECLTGKQVAALREILSGPSNAGSGTPLFFGFDGTAAAESGTWKQWIVNADRGAPSQLVLAEQFFRNMVHDDPDWRIENFSTRDFELAQRRAIGRATLSEVLDATSTDLTQFQERNGKLLMYFGWADALISPYAGVHYYERVVEHMGAQSTGSFFRLFMVPGMTHCQGGPSAHAFGQADVAPALLDEPAYDIRRALEEWVEHARAPERIIAAKYRNDDRAQGIETTRVLCPFPQIAAC